MKTQLSRTKTATVREIMTQNPKTLLPSTLIPIAINQILTQRLSEMPIVESSGKYRGVFSEKSCMRVLASISELIDSATIEPKTATDVMVPLDDLFTLAPETDVFDAMSSLLNKGFSSAPVIDSHGKYQGVFSEITCLGFVIEAAYNKTPSATVKHFTDSEANHLIDASTDLHTIAKVFIESKYERLPVIRGETLIGQISRRDLLSSSAIIATIMSIALDLPKTIRESNLPLAETYHATYGLMSEHTVATFADLAGQTVKPEMDLFSVAQMFFKSPFRYFSVLESGKLLGQLGRSDVLRNAIKILK